MTRAQGLLKNYEEMGISRDRILLRVPGTFEGIQAAKELEAQGIQTHIILVYRFVAKSHSQTYQPHALGYSIHPKILA